MGKWVLVCESIGRAGRKVAWRPRVAKLPCPLGCCSSVSETETVGRSDHQFGHDTCKCKISTY